MKRIAFALALVLLALTILNSSWIAATRIEQPVHDYLATDVLSDADAVVRWIVTEAVARLPLHHPAGGPPPRD
jgi:hypothetical protein